MFFIKKRSCFLLSLAASITLLMVATGCGIIGAGEKTQEIADEAIEEAVNGEEEEKENPEKVMTSSQERREAIEKETKESDEAGEEESPQEESSSEEQESPQEPLEERIKTLDKPKVNGENLLAVVGKETTLGRYAPDNLVDLPDHMSSPGTMLRAEAKEHLMEMYEAAQEDGVELYADSTYRSYYTQKAIFLRNVERRGSIEEANRSSARPGQSEHQLGTTVDFGGTAHDYSSEFANAEPGQWLRENAHKYGFALSYPENSKEVTGYIFEPWHYRYIGVDNAIEWKESGMILEEWLRKQ